MRAPIRIAILECDIPLAEAEKEWGSYGPVFAAMFQEGAESMGDPDVIDPRSGLDITYWNVLEVPYRYPKLDEIDAIMVSGSRYDSFDDTTSWIKTLLEYLHKVVAQERVRIMGVCFGHQIIGRALGAKTGRNEQGWEAAIVKIDLTAKGREVFQQDSLSLHAMHRDAVHFYPPGVEALGSSSICAVQGMYARKRVFTMQAHPEFNGTMMVEAMTKRNEIGVFADENLDEAIGNAHSPHDGLVVARAWLRYLLDE